MKKIKNLTLCFLAGLIASVSTIYAQESPRIKEGYKNAFSIEPFYLTNNGLRLNYERQLASPAHWLEASFIGYVVDFRHEDRDRYLPNSFYTTWFLNGRDIRNAWSLGTEINYKYFLHPFFYLSVGGAYSHTDVVDYANTFHKFQEDGLTFYEHAWGESTQRFDRVSGNFRVGFQTKNYRRVVVGGYVGITLTHSFYSPRDEGDYTSDDITNLRYSGFIPHIGFRIGFRCK
ncbi:MAG: hypothetical protein LBT35_00635 [Tannerella sp.]|nr:hypothetical protein [Tannerella sp.]